jgi:hypothetical protein
MDTVAIGRVAGFQHPPFPVRAIIFHLSGDAAQALEKLISQYSLFCLVCAVVVWEHEHKGKGSDGQAVAASGILQQLVKLCLTNQRGPSAEVVAHAAAIKHQRPIHKAVRQPLQINNRSKPFPHELRALLCSDIAGKQRDAMDAP